LEVENEDLGAIIQNEVYTEPGKRENIPNYKINRKLSNDENVVYVGKNKILLGIRGTDNLDDLRADLGIPVKMFRNFIDKNFGIKRDKDDKNSPISYWEQKYDERVLRQNDFYSQLKKKYPNREIIMGGHSLAGVLIKDIASKNKKDALKGYTFNSWFHPGNLGDDSRLLHRNVAGDLVSSTQQLVHGGTVGSVRDTRAETIAAEKTSGLITAHYAREETVGRIKETIADKVNARELKLLGEGASPAEIAAFHLSETQNINQRLEKVLNRIKFKESTGKKISNRLFENAKESLKEVEEWNHYLATHPDYGWRGTYDPTGLGRDPMTNLIDEFGDTLPRDLKIVKASENYISRLGYLAKAIEKVGIVGELFLATDIIQAIHSSDNFKPRKELRESKKKESKIQKRREKRGEGLMEQLLEY